MLTEDKVESKLRCLKEKKKREKWERKREREARKREAGEGSKMRRQAEAKPKHQPGRRVRGWQLLKVWGQSQGNPKHNGRAL